MTARTSVFVLTALTLATPHLQAARRITGKVVDEDGRAVPGARVSVHMRGLSPRPRPGQGPTTVNPIAVARAAFNSRIQSDSGGAFSFHGIPTSAIVQLCVTSSDPLSVDKCLWSRNANRLEMDADNDAAPVTLKAERGYPLIIRINDPQHLLPDPPSNSLQPSATLAPALRSK
ncbi:MAG: carboxypeptidase regulatory-like domain-containing protein [Bryobacterales bacterium]|nr:carboxypeptidase regulatory-like domain-containing protein [Bryobacterales bacterium]